MVSILPLITAYAAVTALAHAAGLLNELENIQTRDLYVRSSLSPGKYVRLNRRSGQGSRSGRSSPSRQGHASASSPQAYADVSIKGEGRIHKVSGSKVRSKDVYEPLSGPPRTRRLQAADPIHAAAGGATTIGTHEGHTNPLRNVLSTGNTAAVDRTPVPQPHDPTGNHPASPGSPAGKEHVLKASAVGSLATTDMKIPPKGEGKLRVHMPGGRESIDIPGGEGEHVHFEAHLPGQTNAFKVESSVTDGGALQAVGMNMPGPAPGPK